VLHHSICELPTVIDCTVAVTVLHILWCTHVSEHAISQHDLHVATAAAATYVQQYVLMYAEALKVCCHTK
jgi:hypothetical protein